MDNNKVSWVNVIKFAGAVIAFLIGAGFATGQEVLQYFAGYGYEGLLVGAFVLICFVYLCSSFMCAGYDEHFPNTNDIYRYYCGKYIGGFYDYFSIAFIYMSYIVMLGGAGGTFNQYYHLPPAYGAIFMLVVSVGVVILGLGKIVDVIGSIGPIIVLIALGVGAGAIITNPGGIADGVALINSGTLDPEKFIRVGSNWFMSGFSYVGFCLLWLAAFCAAMGTKANSKKEAVMGATLGATGFVAGALVLAFGLLTQFESLYASDIPSLILAAASRLDILRRNPRRYLHDRSPAPLDRLREIRPGKDDEVLRPHGGPWRDSLLRSAHAALPQDRQHHLRNQRLRRHPRHPLHVREDLRPYEEARQVTDFRRNQPIKGVPRGALFFHAPETARRRRAM